MIYEMLEQRELRLLLFVAIVVIVVNAILFTVHSTSKSTRNRFKAMKWWNGLFYCQQQDYNLEVNGDRLKWLDDDQVEQLWKQKHNVK